MTEYEALGWATGFGRLSPCAKSKRGVIIFRRDTGLITSGFNTPPTGFDCDGSDACRRDCGKVCVHAEVAAILRAGRDQENIEGAEMLHVKVVGGVAVPSGPPSCWQCSRAILFAGLSWMWLYEENPLVGQAPILRRYGASEFHEATLRNCHLHVGAECSSGRQGRRGTERTP